MQIDARIITVGGGRQTAIMEIVRAMTITAVADTLKTSVWI